jgi:quinol monooxygenase YgiN
MGGAICMLILGQCWVPYRLHQDNDDPAVFIFYENWESITSLERHINTPHYQNYAAAVKESIIEKAVHKMTCIA